MKTVVAGLGVLVFCWLVWRCLRRCFLYFDFEDGKMVVKPVLQIVLEQL